MATPSATKTWVLLAAAVGFGIAAAVLAGLYLKSREAAIRAALVGPEQEIVRVVVARQDLPRGTLVSSESFAVRGMPKEFVSPDAIRPGDFDRYQGRFLIEPLASGRALLTSFLDETFPIDFSDTVPEGRRAMTVQVDEINSVAGLLRPGNHIDVFVNIPVKVSGFRAASLGSGTPTAEAIQASALQAASASLPPAIQAGLAQAVSARAGPTDVVLPVLQDVRVLAAGPSPYRESLDQLRQPQQLRERRFTSVTLDVSPEQAALLAIAEDKGELLALLRNRKDTSAALFSGVTAFDLVKNSEKMRRMAALRKAAEEAGARIDENGNWVAPDGTVIRNEDLRISADGTVTTTDGKLLAADGVRLNEKGEYVDENGNPLPVGANGVIQRPDGTLVTTNGQVVSGRMNAQGCIIADDGTVRLPDGQVLNGVSVNERGLVLGPDGQVLPDCADLSVAADGTVTDADGNVLAGVSATGPASPEDQARQLLEQVTSEIQRLGTPDEFVPGPSVDLIAGGQGKDGVATVGKLPILE